MEFFSLQSQRVIVTGEKLKDAGADFFLVPVHLGRIEAERIEGRVSLASRRVMWKIIRTLDSRPAR